MCGIVHLFLFVSWVRSYAWHDGIWGQISQTEGFHFSSHEGRLQFNMLRNFGIIEWRPAFGERIVTVRSPHYFPSFEYSQTALGFFVAMPIWFPVALSATLAVTLATKPQFSLRALLIATTLVAVVLGLVVAFGSCHRRGLFLRGLAGKARSFTEHFMKWPYVKLCIGCCSI